jgi:phenylacetate-CoA ligase
VDADMMPLENPLTDPLFEKMMAAYRGRPETWERVNRGLRDALVAYAGTRVPYYRRVAPPGTPFDEIPILTKTVIREEGDALLAEGLVPSRVVTLRTSGSSGEPLAFHRDSAQGPMEYLSAHRFLRRLQDLPDDAATVWVSTRAREIPGDPVPGLRGALSRLLGRRPPPKVMAVQTQTLEPKNVPPLVRAWERLPRWVLYGHASAIGWIAGELDRQGLRLANPPHAVVTTGDTLTPDLRERLALRFGVPVHSWYGSNEINGYAAGTIPGTQRYVFNPLLVHLEVLDDEGRPVPPGEPGRIVVTDLNNYAMPFIRYDTQDVGVASADTVGGFPVIESLAGRSSEVLRLPSGRVVSPVKIGVRLFVGENFVPHVRAFQCAEVAPNHFELRVVWSRGDPGPEVRSAMLATLRAIFDPDTRLEIRAVPELERLPSGKGWVLRREY